MPLTEWTEKSSKRSTNALVAALSSAESSFVDAVEILRDVFDGHASDVLSAEDVVAFLAQEQLKQASEDFDVVAADSLTLSLVDNKDAQEKMHTLVKTIVSEGAIDQNMLRERLDIDVLKACKLVSSDYDKGLMRMRMKMFYKQEKFNLFHEENEGFSKVVTELNQDFTKAGISAEDLITRVRTLVGYFSLDPNRVLDLTLDALELHPQHSAIYLECLRQFTTGTASIANLMGLKLASFAKRGEETPASLFASIARLVGSDLLTLAQLEPHLNPTLEDTKERVRAYVKSVTKYVNTSAMSQEKQAELDASAARAREEETRAKERDQRLGLCIAFLKNGSWDHAETLMSQLPPFYVPSVPAARRAMLNTIHTCIEPLYRDIAAPKLSRTSRRVAAPSAGAMPACTSVVDFASRAMPALASLGPFLADDPILMTKTIRICGHLVTTAKELGEENSAMLGEVEDLFARCILPSLMRCSSNASMPADVWAVLRQLPYQARFKIYGYWKNESWRSQPELLVIRAKTLKKAKGLFQRLTAENASKKMAHSLNKIAFTNPVHLFEYGLRQIEAYANLVEPLCDALKSQTHLAYDCLGFSVLEALSNPQKSRLKKEDLFESSWLQNLASFVGLILRKYPLDFEPVFQFIINRLKENQVLDLIVLREILIKIAGYENVEDMTEVQLKAMAGGPVLRQRGSTFSNARLTKDQRRALKHMTETFTSAQDEILVPLILLIAQQRVELVYGQDKERPVVLIGELYDKCQEVFMQLMECVEANIDEKLYFEQLPSLPELCNTYGLEIEAAMFLNRRRLTARIEELGAKAGQGTVSQKYMQAAQEATAPVVDFVRSLQPSSVWHEMTPELYTTFWTLSLYDLEVPSAAYTHVIADLEEANRQNRPNPGDTARTEKKKRREIASNESTIKDLKAEESRQKEMVKCAREMLTEQSKSFVPETHSLKSAVVSEFLRLCVYPRCFFSAADAVYCAKFAETLHTLRTPHWSTVLYFNYVFRHTACIIMSATENEASRFGRFLNETLRVLSRFHASPTVYQRECAPTPGFIASFKKGEEPKSVKYAEYRKMCYNWQSRLLKDFLSMLKSKDPSLIRRAVVVMIKVVDHFPAVQNLGKELLKTVEAVLKDDTTRQDVKLLVTSYQRQLLDRATKWAAPAEYFPTVVKPRAPAKQKGGDKGGSGGTPTKKAKTEEKSAPTSSSSSSKKGDETSKAKGTGNGSNVADGGGAADKAKASRKSTGSKTTGGKGGSAAADDGRSSSKRKSSSDSRKGGKKSGEDKAKETATTGNNGASSRRSLPSRGGSTEDLQRKRAKVTSSSASSSTASSATTTPTTRRERTTSGGSNSEREGRRRKDRPSSRESRGAPPPPPSSSASRRRR